MEKLYIVKGWREKESPDRIHITRAEWLRRKAAAEATATDKESKNG